MTKSYKYSIVSIHNTGISGFYCKNIYLAGTIDITKDANKNKKLFLRKNTLLSEAYCENLHCTEYRIYF